MCYACGRRDHMKRDPNCPAKKLSCHNCGKQGHFEKMCKSEKPSRTSRKKRQQQSVRTVDAEYAFTVNSSESENEFVNVTVGGVETKLLVDSGATVNVIGNKQWEFLKARKVRCTSEKSTKELYAYGGNRLSVLGTFQPDVQINGRDWKIHSEFYVICEEGPGILCKKSATELGLLKVEIPHINMNYDRKSQLKEKFPYCFTGIGTLKNYSLKIPIDPDVKPVIQPVRRVAYHLRDKLELKLYELVSQDIIEKVEEPSLWVSPVVVVPKKNDIRLCVDMRQANQAVLRERYPIPTVEEVLQDFNQSTVFSKLDIKLAYHQIVLESRQITTFMTHKGMYRYKLLMFGISCAPEMYNKIIQQTLDGCDGVQSIFDDIVVHGKNYS